MLKTPGFSGRLVRWGLFGALLISLFGLTSPALPTVRADTVFDIPNGDIAALKAALNTPGTNIINLAPNGFYTLTTVDNNNSGENGLPIISNTITINGRGATLTRDSDAPEFRFFLVLTSGNLTLNNLTISNGKANNAAGAILSIGSVNLNYTTFYSNTAYGEGGAIISEGAGGGVGANPNYFQPGQSYTATLNISYSTFISNSATTQDSSGGAISSGGFGGSANVSNTVTGGNGLSIVKINGSSFISNTASQGGAIFTLANGGDYTTGGTGTSLIEVTNSTFAFNSSDDPGGGSAIETFNNNNEANIRPDTVALTLTNSTVVANRAAALYMFKANNTVGTSTAALYNTIVASNFAINCATASGTFSNTLSFSPGQNNLEYQGGASGSATCGTGSTVVTTDPVASLTPTNNGGPTLTVLPAGPAIDGGNNAICAAAPVNNYDQRGYSRPVGTACDVGAVESGGKPIVRNNTDNGDSMAVGSLSFYLKYATDGQPIGFALPNGQTITVNGPLPPLLPNARLGTGCDGVTILGTGVLSDGLVLKGGNIIRGVAVKGFGGRQIVTAGTGSQLSCTKASKN